MSQKRNKKPRLSQKTLDVTLSQSDSNLKLDELIQRCVRFFILNMSLNTPIQRNKIIQHVFKEKPGKVYDTVIKETTKILKDIYGIELQVLETESSVKKYILTSALEYPELIKKSTGENFKSSLTFLILAHIFMSKGTCTEKSLWDFLAELNIKPENTINGIGQVHTFVTKNLVKEQLLMLDVIKTAQDDEGHNKSKYSWGPVAEQSISKKDIFKFYSQMYDGINLKDWAQYEEAMKQYNENEAGSSNS